MKTDLNVFYREYVKMNESIEVCEADDGEVVSTAYGRMIIIDEGIVTDKFEVIGEADANVSSLGLSGHGQAIVQKVLATKLGTKHTVTYVRDIGNDKTKMKPEFLGTVKLLKRTAADVRNVDYENTKAVMNARASGEKETLPQPLRGMEWVIFPTIIRSLKTGKVYISFKMTSAAAVWILDGKEVSKDEVKKYLKEVPTREMADTVIITIDPELVTSFN